MGRFHLKFAAIHQHRTTHTFVRQCAVLGYRGREVDGLHIPHRGEPKRVSKAEKRRLKRRPALKPSIGHLKADHRRRRNFLKGALGDVMKPILVAARLEIRWLMRWLESFLALDIGTLDATTGLGWIRSPAEIHAGGRIAAS